MSSNEAVIRVSNVAKKFCRTLRRSMAYGILDLAQNLVGMKPDNTGLRKAEFWALQDINFELRRGQILGLIGINGSGKTTLLRMIAGIFPPDKGEITVRGRVGALIALGAGFHGHLTGRENIYLNGTILGMSRREIDGKLDEIVDFAEIGEFIDSPVTTYSSGMRVRLGFSIAAAISPDVLLIDEILAVGDVGFRSKCFNIMEERRDKCAVIFVSHTMPQVGRICTDIIVLDRGKVAYEGDNVPRGIEYYFSTFDRVKGLVSGSGRAVLHSVRIFAGNPLDVDFDADVDLVISYLDDLYVELEFTADPEVTNLNLTINIVDREIRGIAQCISDFSNVKIRNTGQRMRALLKLPQILFNPGLYYFSIVILDDHRGETMTNHHCVCAMQVVGEKIGFTPIQMQGEWTIE